MIKNEQLWGPLQQDEAKAVVQAVEKCKKCWGRGHIGWNKLGKMIPCECVKRVYTRLLQERVAIHQQKERVICESSVLSGIYLNYLYSSLVTWLTSRATLVGSWCASTRWRVQNQWGRLWGQFSVTLHDWKHRNDA